MQAILEGDSDSAGVKQYLASKPKAETILLQVSGVQPFAIGLTFFARIFYHVHGIIAKETFNLVVFVVQRVTIFNGKRWPFKIDAWIFVGC